MITKNIPATPLPFKVGPLAGSIYGANGVEVAKVAWPRTGHLQRSEKIAVEQRCVANAAYLNHAANAYPKLIAALRWYAGTPDGGGNARHILRELGEE